MRAESKCIDKERMEALRKSYLEKVLSYSGVPYARRYHEPTCKPPACVGSRSPALARTRVLMCAPCPPTQAPTYRSKLFLDCCGLVRRALRDLQEEFGFTIGPGNQAYQVASGGGAAVEGVSLL